VIDLHTHILPAVDDGAPDMDVSLAMARAAVVAGVHTMVATPHVNERYDLDPMDIGEHVGRLNLTLARTGIALAVLPGAEVAHSRAGGLSDRDLRATCLGGHSALLIESPYTPSPFFDEFLFDLQLRGFRPVLAHPERCPMFQSDVDRVAALVARGILCSVNTGSLAGRFGRTARRTAVELLRRGLVHSLASDCHDTERRPPGLRDGLNAVRDDIPGIEVLGDWLTAEVPAALVAGAKLPPRPALPERPPSRWARVRRRRGGEA